MSDQLAANEALDRALKLRLEELRPKPTVMTYNCLKREGIHTVGDIVAKTEAELLDMLRGNWKGVDEVNLLLAELNQTHGLDLKLTASEIRDRVLGLDIEEFEPSTGTYNCLKSEGIHTVGDLIAKTAEELLLVLRGSRRRLEEARGLLQQVNKTYNLNPALELRPGDSPFL